jgi:hypothetical protein
MKKILGLFTNRSRKAGGLRGSMTYRALAIGGVLAASSLATSSTAQGPSAALSGQMPDVPAGSVAIPLTPAQMPPMPPHVSYVDGQLTIVAENCNLGDILGEVRRLTGVQIDLPAAASEERMAAQLGPGRPREVLISLLSSTGFNYLIQAGDDDPSEVQSILLLPRGKKSTSNSSDPLMAATRLQRRANRRMDPAPVAEEVPEPESPAPAQPADVADSSSAHSRPATADVQAAPAAQAELRPAAASDTKSDANQTSLSPTEQMMQGLQRLYEQRRQMTQQQNQQTEQGPKPASAN